MLCKTISLPAIKVWPGSMMMVYVSITPSTASAISSPICWEKGISKARVMCNFKNFITSIKGDLTIKGFGDDVCKSGLQYTFPFLKDCSNITYQQVELPPWEERQYKKYHIASYNMKKASQILSCHSQNHRIKFNPAWKRQGKHQTHSRLAKLSYGYHCALIDSFELAFADNTLDYYCCDSHFCQQPEQNTETYTDTLTEPLVFIE